MKPLTRDDYRDALAYLRAYVTEDQDAIKVLDANADNHQMLIIMTTLTANLLKGKLGDDETVLAWLDLHFGGYYRTDSEADPA